MSGHGKKLTEAMVREIAERIYRGEKHVDIAVAMGVTPSAVSNIVTGRSWRRVTGFGPCPTCGSWVMGMRS